MIFLIEGMNGVDTLKEIKKIDNNAKVIMISAMGQKCFIKDACKAGALDFVVKPFNHLTVNNAVKKYIGTINKV